MMNIYPFFTYQQIPVRDQYPIVMGQETNENQKENGTGAKQKRGT